MSDVPLLEVTDLAKHFPVRRGLLFDREVDRLKAVDGVLERRKSPDGVPHGCSD